MLALLAMVLVTVFLMAVILMAVFLMAVFLMAVILVAVFLMAVIFVAVILVGRTRVGVLDMTMQWCIESLHRGQTMLLIAREGSGAAADHNPSDQRESHRAPQWELELGGRGLRHGVVSRGGHYPDDLERHVGDVCECL